MEPVYRSAKLLREQLKAGATLAEFNRLRGNFATELGIIRDRMQAKPRAARFLQPYFSAYANALDAYSLVSDVWEYNSAMDACTGPRPPDHTSAQFHAAPLSEQMQLVIVDGEWSGRLIKCIESFQGQRLALTQRSEHLMTHCGPDVEFHIDCIVRNADAKVTTADKIFMQR